MLIIPFANCRVRIFPDVQYLETLFPDGAIAPAAPQFGNAGQLSTAEQLGYESDLWRMVVDHEVLHTVLAEARGQLYSPTLWAVAHGQPAGGPTLNAQYVEEAEVLAFQRLLMTGDRGALGEQKIDAARRVLDLYRTADLGELLT